MDFKASSHNLIPSAIFFDFPEINKRAAAFIKAIFLAALLLLLIIESKKLKLSSLLFTIISMPFVNKIIEKSMGERKTVIKLGVKTVVFMVLFYIIKSFVINEKK